ncbi:MAG: cation-transporting P-type ATPase, partial [Candidatus Aenigmarchaeota archaeon]|nr:cation-transporting P-type ATPase [Candidatus Aenigmarchaeota archaeon]
KRKSIFYKFLVHFKDLFSVLLIIAGILSIIDGMWDMGSMIFTVVLINTVFSLFQEWRAEKAMETLRRWVPEYAKVFRDGELKKVLVKELVPGDVIFLEEGDRIPADGRLIEAFDLWVNNVPLTGESEPQPRNAKSFKAINTAYFDTPNLVFMSTSVAKGCGKAVVSATGMNTKFGEIAGLTQEIGEQQSPLQKEIAYTAKYDFILSIVVGSIFLLVSLVWLHLSIYSSILFMIGVMISLVPEGLQVTVSSALAINVLKMAKENVLVKQLDAVQTLGSVTVICTDKTGTITKGEMTVKKIWVPNEIVKISGVGFAPSGKFTYNGKTLEKDESHRIEKLLEISAICNSAKVEQPSDTNRSWSIIGDPTDGALLVAAMKYGINVQNLLEKKPVAKMIPFDSKRKMMTTIHKNGDRVFVYTKGAPRNILSICDKIIVNNHIENLAGKNLQSVEARIHEFANEGLRVIAMSYKEIKENHGINGKKVETKMIFVGLAAMEDPPRPEVQEAVRMAKQAGIKTVIITGDYGPTAQAIATEVGIVDSAKCRIVRGIDLETKSDQEIVEEVRKGNVIFARVSPEQKLRIVTVLKKNGEIVAVTGDGANDAPSLKEADIGVAMGTSGTDVAREAADIILLDDSFASIVKAVESGRVIYENIRKFILYVFSHNWAELIPFILYALFNIPLPLLVVQILAIDLIIDVIPSLALSREPPEAGIMKERPRSKKERLFSTKVMLRSCYIGLIIAAGIMLACLHTWSIGGWHLGMQLDPKSTLYIKGTTMVFAGIVIGQVGNVLASRTNKTSIFKTSLTNNKWIWFGIIAQISLIVSMVYIPLLQKYFGTTALNLSDWIILAFIACTVIFAEEIRKWFARRLS